MNTACIIGASRGLGLALAEEYLKRGWQVVATVRSVQTGLHALVERYAKTLEIERVDINEPDQVAALRSKLGDRQIDLLFVNAGVSSGHGETIADVSTEEFARVMITNALSPMRAIEAFQSLVSPKGVIAAMSSGLGSVADNERGGWEVYRASKAALNTLMRSFAARHPGDTRTMLVVAPGWIRTDMGGPQAPFSIEESIPLIADMITSNSGKPGLRYLNRLGETVRW
jgi:NAD(P)-dependent dehydrogenase (short-subunit alcohol dehydrogenase family)